MTKQSKFGVEKIEYCGATFKIISLEQGQEIIQGLTAFDGEKIFDLMFDDDEFQDEFYDVFTNSEQNPEFTSLPGYDKELFSQMFPSNSSNETKSDGVSVILLAETNVQIEKLELSYFVEGFPDILIKGFIFQKDLTVDKYISAYDKENSPLLIVLGNTVAKNIKLGGNTHYFEGDLHCDSLIGISDGEELYVKGQTKAKLIYTENLAMHFGELSDSPILINIIGPEIRSIFDLVNNEDGSKTEFEFLHSSTHHLKDVVEDSFLDYDYESPRLKESACLKAFEDNRSIIDQEKLEIQAQYFNKNFKTNFLEMLSDLSKLEEVKKHNGIYRTYRSHPYCETESDFHFTIFNHGDVIYQELSYTLLANYNIQLRALLDIKTKNFILVNENMDKEGNTLCVFTSDGPEDEDDFIFSAVKLQMIQAYTVLMKG